MYQRQYNSALQFEIRRFTHQLFSPTFLFIEKCDIDTHPEFFFSIFF